MENTYTFYWPDGTREKLSGPFPAAAACKSPNKGHKYIWETGEDFQYVWNAQLNKWDPLNVKLVSADERFKQDEFFENVIKSFTNTGKFTFVSCAEINTDKYTYHVTFCYPCRNTTLVFRLKGCALLLVLHYSECVYKDTDTYEEYWSIRIDTHLKDNWDNLATPAEYGNHQPSFKHGRHAGWSSRDGNGSRTWNLDCDHFLSTADLVEDILQAVNQMNSYLTRGTLKSGTTSWEPTYCFGPECKEDFWNQFDRSKLSSILKKEN
jgi:hypothetical protein